MNLVDKPCNVLVMLTFCFSNLPHNYLIVIFYKRKNYLNSSLYINYHFKALYICFLYLFKNTLLHQIALLVSLKVDL